MTDCGEMSPLSSLLPAKPSKPRVRLVGGNTKREGRVEVSYGGIWGTVCDDGWSLMAATIVCKELGFGKALEASLHSKYRKGMSSEFCDLLCSGDFLSTSKFCFESPSHRSIDTQKVGLSCPSVLHTVWASTKGLSWKGHALSMSSNVSCAEYLKTFVP